jgi:hypothetical protein
LMKVQYWEEMANHSDPESCVAHREVWSEALTGETGRPAIAAKSGFRDADAVKRCGRQPDQAIDASLGRSARSRPALPGSFRTEAEISAVPGGTTLRLGRREPRLGNRGEKSDALVLPGKPSNKGIQPAEMVEGRSAAKGNADQAPAPRTQSRTSCASTDLEGVRQAARRNRRLRFTALLHHITPQLLIDSFYSLQKNAAAGVDGVTWSSRRASAVAEHRLVHAGAYRRRRGGCIPRQMVDNACWGSPHRGRLCAGRRHGVERSTKWIFWPVRFRPTWTHNALDALTAGTGGRKVN